MRARLEQAELSFYKATHRPVTTPIESAGQKESMERHEKMKKNSRELGSTEVSLHRSKALDCSVDASAHNILRPETHTGELEQKRCSVTKADGTKKPVKLLVFDIQDFLGHAVCSISLLKCDWEERQIAMEEEHIFEEFHIAPR
ncbi:hypothetical protein EYF80_026116 [Liparis tanakae]|uniref:Uncharacterized protein n=1 Tax=Liparis tanakae TaxID=230148 RepID=A0A4Z2HCV7_9TELE|nr:hypothetical protein EYF80_026116 [Liparis tanakae]